MTAGERNEPVEVGERIPDARHTEVQHALGDCFEHDCAHVGEPREHPCEDGQQGRLRDTGMSVEVDPVVLKPAATWTSTTRSSGKRPQQQQRLQLRTSGSPAGTCTNSEYPTAKHLPSGHPRPRSPHRIEHDLVDATDAQSNGSRTPSTLVAAMTVQGPADKPDNSLVDSIADPVIVMFITEHPPRPMCDPWRVRLER